MVITGIGMLADFDAVAKDLFNTIRSGCNKPENMPTTKEKRLAFAGDIAKKAYFASKAAIEDSGLICRNRDDMGIFIGSAFASLASTTDFEQKSDKGGMRAIMPMDFMNTVMNAPAGQLAILLKLSGINITNSDGSTASIGALTMCADILEQRRINAALVGGIEESSAICKQYMELNGTEASEGYCVFVAENKDDAVNRGAHIYAELMGSAYKYSHRYSETEVLELITSALRNAGVSSEDVAFMTISCGKNTPAESAASKTGIKTVEINKIMGDTYGASGAFVIAAAAAIFEKGALPDGTSVPKSMYAIAGSFGFDGFMGCCVIKGGR